MSFTIRQLNADSTFLLTFDVPGNSDSSDCNSDHPHKSSSSFSILVDPWLNGHYTVWKPSFAIAHHTTEPIISSLAEIADSIDVILISQDKSDHCHQESLCTLPADTNITIMATPAAAKKIRSWNYFRNPNIIHALPAYHSRKPETIFRIPIPSSSSHAGGLVTLANIPTKLDVASLHNAIGITYQPYNKRIRTSSNQANVHLMTESHASQHTLLDVKMDSMSSIITDVKNFNSDEKILDLIDVKVDIEPSGTDDAASLRTASGFKTLQTKRNVRRVAYDTENAISVLYSPHGVSKATLQPYINHHLTPLKGALPLTALFHSFNVEANPWYMGGIVSAGAPGGIKLAQLLKAKHWISAHDEVKDVSGMAIKFLRSRQYDIDEVTAMMPNAHTEVIALQCGEERCFTG